MSIYINKDDVIALIDNVYNLLDMYEVTPSIKTLIDFKQKIIIKDPSINLKDIDNLTATLEAKFSNNNLNQPQDKLLAKWEVRINKKYKLSHPDPKFNNIIAVPKQRLRKYILCDCTFHNGNTEEIKILPGMLKEIPGENY